MTNSFERLAIISIAALKYFKGFFAYPNAVVLFCQLSYHRRCQHPAPNDGVGTALPEAAQPAVADQGALHFPTRSSSKMPTLDLLRLPLKRDWVA